MKKRHLVIGYFYLLVLSLAGCEVVGGIFKAGVWSGILIVALVIGLVVFILSKMGGNK